MRVIGSPRTRIAALACALAAGGSLVSAASSFAAGNQFPLQGSNCQTDGKISGVGSTLAGNLLKAEIAGYASDVCGYSQPASNLNLSQSGATAWSSDPAPIFTNPASPNTASPNSTVAMVNYNWTTQDGKKSNNGSGEGLQAMACRYAQFGGSDFGYSTPMLNALVGAPTQDNWGFGDPYQLNWTPTGNTWTGSSPTCALNTGVTPPYPPAPEAASSETTGYLHSTGYPKSTDTAQKMMSFPIGVGAAAIAVNLAGCTMPANGIVTLSGQDLSDIFSGKVSNWSQITDSGATCANLPIVRTVRQDQSGTTYAVMSYLNHVQSTTLCDGLNTWSALANQGNGVNAGAVDDSNWPDQAGGTGVGTCDPNTSAVKRATGTGSPTGAGSMVNTVANTPGAIGYGELSNWAGAQSVAIAGSGTSGTNTFTATTTSAIPAYVGEAVSGTGVPAGTTITAISGNDGTTAATLTLSNALTANATSVTLANTDMVLPELPATSTATPGEPGSSMTSSAIPASASALGSANCAHLTAGLGTNSLPGGSSDSTGAVGLDYGATPAADWAVDVNNPATGQPYGDITAQGDQWPICTFTYDFVWANQPRGTLGGSGAALVSTGPLQGQTYDQERTTYGFFSYLLSPAGQALVSAWGYQPLPAAWAAQERTDFQLNF